MARGERPWLGFWAVVIAALIGSGGLLYVQHREAQQERDLYEEEALREATDTFYERWNTSEMVFARRVARSTIDTHASEPYVEWHARATPEQRDALAKVFDFFREAYQRGTAETIDRVRLKRLMRNQLNYWLPVLQKINGERNSFVVEHVDAAAYPAAPLAEGAAARASRREISLSPQEEAVIALALAGADFLQNEFYTYDDAEIAVEAAAPPESDPSVTTTAPASMP